MEKRLGIDVGTNSLGWAIVEVDDEGCTLLDRGVDIFQEGVAREKNQEKPAVQDRTDARALRRHYFRRRLRKIALLRVLVRHDLCPALSEEQLNAWQSKGIYPLDDAFIRWQRTDDNADRNPYRDRFRCLTEELDLACREERYVLGRALYHLCQRRGFLSNRKDAGNEAEEGKVKQEIKTLSADMAAAGCEYLGEYFYRLYQRKEKIRKHYTARNEHYLAEFRAICRKQRLDEELRQALEKAIFYQRPLKSQKGLVGKCTFEKDKSRCPVSHPRFEEFRMLQFINNVRVTGPGDAEPRPLSPEEVEIVRPLFLRKSKPHFDFEDIAKKIAGKGNYACRGELLQAPYRFNCAGKSTVTGSPVSALFASVFGDDWQREICSLYTLGAGKNEEQILNDVWHVLFAFEDEERLQAWLQEKLQLSADDAKTLAAFRLPQGYASLSLNVINKILPYLRRGYRYDEAVFFANLGKVPEGFSNRQGVDVGIIGRYARLYLQTVFDRVYTVKGATTAAFRRMWGLQEEYAAKERVNHVHHCIDAITIACIGSREYALWAQYVRQDELYRRGEADKPRCGKPWPTFTEDVRATADELLISHHTPDNMPKQSRKRLRVRGKVQRNDRGEVKYMQGDTARGALHQQTFYGAIERDGEIRYVVRKSLDQLLPTDVDKIVDETVKRKVQEAIEAFGFKEAMDPQKHTVWMNKDKNVPIRKVRILTGVKNPILLKPHRDVSVKEYKRYYHVVNDGNYCMAIYEGRDRQGRLKRTFEIVNKLEAARYFKRSADRESRPDLVPLSDVNGYSLKYLLKTGTMVLFYENSPDELYECSVGELAKRLYKVVGMAQDGRVQFLFHQEARDQKAVTAECGMGISVFDARHPAPKLRIRVSNFKMFVEGYDFELTVTGEVKFKR